MDAKKMFESAGEKGFKAFVGEIDSDEQSQLLFAAFNQGVLSSAFTALTLAMYNEILTHLNEVSEKQGE